MNLVGVKVTHKGFGSGEIIELVDGKIRVEFQSTTKLFAYPEAFERFLSVEDKAMELYLQQEIRKVKEEQEEERALRHKQFEEERYAEKKKSIANSHIAFAIIPEDVDTVYKKWEATTGLFQSGKNRGKARVPKNLNYHSICILTSKHPDEEENRRFIIGVYMPEEDFCGDKCMNGRIKAHKDYRIRWEENHESLYFWDYFAKEDRLEKWGGIPAKYVTKQLGEKILSDMMSFAMDEEEHENIKTFYTHYCDQNNV